jgi:hypothetical protein
VGRKGGYALLTEPVLRSLGIDGERAGLPAHIERYEHLGDVRCFVRDLSPLSTPGRGQGGGPEDQELAREREAVRHPQAIA